MSTYDIRAGKISVLLTLTDPEAAERIVAAIEAERGHLYQADGVPFAVVQSDRDAGDNVEGDTYAAGVHGLKVAEAIQLIEAAETEEEALAILEAEKANPRSMGPRVSVVNAAEERLGEIATSDG